MLQTRFSLTCRSTVLVTGGLILILLNGCGAFSSRDGLGTGFYLPLTVQLRTDPSVTSAQVTYQDACGQQKTLPLGEQLSSAIKRKTGRVFEKVITENTETLPLDGYQDVSVGLATLDLLIPRRMKKSYPATLNIGLDFAYTAADGTVLFRKKLQSFGRGEVDVTEFSCDVAGLDQIAREAIEGVTDGMAKQLGTSSKIVEAASVRTAATTGGTTNAPVPPSPVVPRMSSDPSTAFPAAPQNVVSKASAVSGEPATLVFRAIVRDENRNQLLHQGETISVEIEVTNEGPGDALGVEILTSGTPELIEQIPGVVPVGDIPRGEVKRVSVDGKAGAIKEAIQAELTLAVRTRSPGDQLPQAKRFVVSMKPESASEAAAMPVDVDVLPKQSGKLKQPKAIGIAVGIGRFRDEGLPRVKYASRDAEVMASYWQAVGGVPSDRIRKLTDEHALKSDLAEVLEEWLPAKADSTTVVYVYVSGRAVVEASTGAVSIIPFDGSLSSNARSYSLRRMQEALVKVSIQRAIVILDLSLESVAKSEGAEPAFPLWEQSPQGKDKVMWMVGNRTIQEAHSYDPGQHGLFTYEILKGLAGAADVDKDGTILAGELCAYAKGQVKTIAREQFGNEQEPVCIPGPKQGAAVRLQPVARLK